MAKKNLCQGFGRDVKWATEQEKEPGVYLYANRCPTDGPGRSYIVQQVLIGTLESCDYKVRQTMRFGRNNEIGGIAKFGFCAEFWPLMRVLLDGQDWTHRRRRRR